MKYIISGIIIGCTIVLILGLAGRNRHASPIVEDFRFETVTEGVETQNEEKVAMTDRESTKTTTPLDQIMSDERTDSWFAFLSQYEDFDNNGYGDGSQTLIVPTNEAFNALPQATRDRLADLPRDEFDALLLRYQITPPVVVENMIDGYVFVSDSGEDLTFVEEETQQIFNVPIIETIKDNEEVEIILINEFFDRASN